MTVSLYVGILLTKDLNLLYNNITLAENCSPRSKSRSQQLFSWRIFVVVPFVTHLNKEVILLCFLKILLTWFTCSGPSYSGDE